VSWRRRNNWFLRLKLPSQYGNFISGNSNTVANNQIYYVLEQDSSGNLIVLGTIECPSGEFLNQVNQL